MVSCARRGRSWTWEGRCCCRGDARSQCDVLLIASWLSGWMCNGIASEELGGYQSVYHRRECVGCWTVVGAWSGATVVAAQGSKWNGRPKRATRFQVTHFHYRRQALRIHQFICTMVLSCQTFEDRTALQRRQSVFRFLSTGSLPGPPQHLGRQDWGRSTILHAGLLHSPKEDSPVCECWVVVTMARRLQCFKSLTLRKRHQAWRKGGNNWVRRPYFKRSHSPPLGGWLRVS